MRISVLLYLIGIMIASLVSDKPSYATVILDITDFGIKPNSGLDLCIPLKSALEKARAIDGPVTIRFPRGRYDFYKSNATKVHYKVSGIHQSWDFTIAIHIKDQKNLTISGDSSLFIIHGEMTPFAIVNSENINIEDLIVDHARPNVSEFRVLDVGKTWMDVRIHPDSKFMIGENGEFWWVNADGQKYKAGTAQWYDSKKDETARTWDPSAEAIKSEQLSDNTVRFHFDKKPDSKSGLNYQTRFPIRKNQGALIYCSRNVQWRDMTIRFSPGLGFLGQFSENLSFQNVCMEPDPESGRTCASFADAIHLCGCTGNILVENCRLVGLQDDHMNFYNNLLIVKAKEDSKHILAGFASTEQQCDTNMFSAQDQITFNDPKTMLPILKNKVIRTEWAENMFFRITLEKEINDPVKGLILENRTKIPELVEIRNNYLGRVPTRSILIYSSKKAIIENNTIHRSQMPAILVRTPDPPYNLQGVVEDLTIRNNVFYECGGMAEKAVIAFNPQIEELDYQNPLYKNVKILNNLFIQKEKKVSLVLARGTKGILFRGNRAELTGADQALLSFTSCSGVQVDHNWIFNQDHPLKIDFINSAPRELQVTPPKDWIINTADQ